MNLIIDKTLLLIDKTEIEAESKETPIRDQMDRTTIIINPVAGNNGITEILNEIVNPLKNTHLCGN